MPFAIGHGLNPLLTDWIDYPQGVNLMWNTAAPLPALLVAPLTLTAGPVLAYNVLLTAGIALTAWSGELAAARFVSHRGTALIGGLLTGFSPYLTAHALGHLNLVIAFLPGLALVLLHDLWIARRLRWWVAGGLLGLAAAAQLLTGEEIVAATAVATAAGAGVWLLGRLLRPPGDRTLALPDRRHAALGLGVAAAVGLVLSAAPLAVQLFGPQRTLHPVPGAIAGNDLAGFIVPTTLQALHPVAVPVAGIFAEQNNYLGIPLLAALVAATWWLRRDRIAVWAAALALVLAVLALGPHLYVAGRRLPVVLPWRLVTPIPVVNDVLPNRLMLFVYLLAGILLAMAADRARAARRGVLVGAGIAIALLPLWPTAAFPATPANTPAYFAGGVQRDLPSGAVALVTPYSQPDAMLWQAQSGLWFRMPEGYARVPGCGGLDTDFTPPGATSRALAGAGPADVAAIRQELAYWRVAEVIVGPGSPAGAAALFRSVTGDPGHHLGGVLVFPVRSGPAPAEPPSTLCRT